MKDIFLSVVIPAYNEEKNIKLGSLENVILYLEKQQYTWEVIVVNDGSTDDTLKLLNDFCNDHKHCNILNNSHQGKASSVISGVQASKGTYVLFCDLDQATPIREVEKIIPFFSQGYDIVIGSRQSNREGAPLTRVIMARGFIFLRSFVLGLRGISDTQCGFKAFKRVIAIHIFDRLTLYKHHHVVSGSMVTAGFDIELLFLAHKLGYKIKEVPVQWHYVETRRVNPISDSIKGLMDIIIIRINAFRGRYGS